MRYFIKYSEIKRNGILQWGNNPTDILLFNVPEHKSVRELNDADIRLGYIMYRYHYYVTLDGDIYAMRPVMSVGGHKYGLNAHAISIGLECDEHVAIDIYNNQCLAVMTLIQRLTRSFRMTTNPVMAIDRTNRIDAIMASYKSINVLNLDERNITDLDDFRSHNSCYTVGNVQTVLYNLGYLQPDHITDSYDRITQSAVMRFQADNNIPADGIIGMQTIEQLTKRISETNTVIPFVESDVVTKINKLLNDNDPTLVVSNITIFENMMGLLANGEWTLLLDTMAESILTNPTLRMGCSDLYAIRYIQWRLGIAINGIYDTVMYNTVCEYQKKNNLAVDGVVGPETWQVFNMWK